MRPYLLDLRRVPAHACSAPARSSFKGQTPREAAWNVATRVLPCLIWMQNYDVKKQLLRDIAAGVAVTFLIIPQGLSYAGIAGLPAIYGLCVCPCLRLALATCSCTDTPRLCAQTLIFCRSFFSRCSPAHSTCRLAPWRWCRC